MSQESTIKELTEAMIETVLDETTQDGESKDGETKRDVVEIKYKKASEGDRERPWVISNTMLTLGEMAEGKRIPLISLFESEPEKVKDHWTTLTIKNKDYMVCKKTFLFMTNCACELFHDKTQTVVTHIFVHSEHEKQTEENKNFWKRQFAKYMKVGAMGWNEVEEQWGIDADLKKLKLEDKH